MEVITEKKIVNDYRKKQQIIFKRAIVILTALFSVPTNGNQKTL
jgi:hypothetical protein